jgi:hypothetical protein
MYSLHVKAKVFIFELKAENQKGNSEVSELNKFTQPQVEESCA